ncbi:MAG TPA: arginine deiminase-related protein [bacterium]|nr:arginine deiminase-related protein [bacterium]
MDVHSVLMGDPGEFHIAGGANPFTRTWWGRKKYVNLAKAIEQWQGLRSLLVSLGVRVHVIPASHENPGLVYPANFGVRLGDTFVLSNLLPTRSGERPVYEAFLKGLGLKTVRMRHRFEGEAEFFPVGSRYLFTYGAVKNQRFKPRFAIPPWMRVYGFRTERHAMDELKAFLPTGTEIVDFELIEESHYHGDTVFCSFGPNREFLLAYLEGVSEADRERCRHLFKENLIVLSSRDGFHYAANSFQVETRDGLKLLMPEGVSDSLLGQVRERGVTPVAIDVSEFLKKGGGAVKCMIGDLGNLPQPPP